jgi:hypothetical protein
MNCFFQLQKGVQRHCKDCPKPNRERIIKMESGESVIICTEIKKALTEKKKNCKLEFTKSDIDTSAEFKAFLPAIKLFILTMSALLRI